MDNDLSFDTISGKVACLGTKYVKEYNHLILLSNVHIFVILMYANFYENNQCKL